MRTLLRAALVVACIAPATACDEREDGEGITTPRTITTSAFVSFVDRRPTGGPVSAVDSAAVAAVDGHFTHVYEGMSWVAIELPIVNVPPLRIDPAVDSVEVITPGRRHNFGWPPSD